ncbi:hypothetical protein ACWGID_21310 [Kribbella sp. NPDC054772]
MRGTVRGLAVLLAVLLGWRLDHYGHIGYDRHDADMVTFDRWLRQAFRAKGPSACNTWAAPAGSVSRV